MENKFMFVKRLFLYLLPLIVFLLPIHKSIAISLLVVAGIIYTIEFFSVTIFSFLKGAEHALKNPPTASRITFIHWAYIKDILGIDDKKSNTYSSEPFMFDPPIAEASEVSNEKITYMDMGNILENIFPKKSKGGRKFGSLSSDKMPGTKAKEIIPILRELKNAEEREDGSFSKLCDKYGIPYTTGKDWMTRYKKLITRN